MLIGEGEHCFFFLFFIARQKESTGTSRMWLALSQSVIDSRFRMGTNFLWIWAPKPTFLIVFFFFIIIIKFISIVFSLSLVEDSPGI